MTTPFFSASGTIFRRAATQLSMPVRSSIPLRLPEKVMTFRQPSAAVASMRLVDRLQARVVVLRVVQADRQAVRRGHRADQAVRLERRELVGPHQVEPDQPDRLRGGGQLVDRDLAVAPPAGRLLQPALRDRRPLRALARRRPTGRRQPGRPGDRRLHQRSPVHPFARRPVRASHGRPSPGPPRLADRRRRPGAFPSSRVYPAGRPAAPADPAATRPSRSHSDQPESEAWEICDGWAPG